MAELQSGTIRKVRPAAAGILVALLLAGASFLLQSRLGLGLADPGYLWYGVQQVGEGGVPIRDFMSYEPGRYYVSALLAKAIGGDALWGTRVALGLSLWAAMAIPLALLGQRMGWVAWRFLVLAGLTLMLWMVPRYKSFDYLATAALIGGFSFLVAKPVLSRCFLGGVVLGLVALIGRNHGLYGGIAAIGVYAWLLWARRAPGVGLSSGLAFAGGVVVGFSPFLAMMVLVPGFSDSVWASLAGMVEIGSTNLTLEVPWPWRVEFDPRDAFDSLKDMAIGSLFIGVLAAAVIAPPFVFFRAGRVSPPVVASAFLALPYAHYAFSRADREHLAHGILPLLVFVLAALAVARRSRRRTGIGAVTLVSLILMVSMQPGFGCRTGKCAPVDVNGRIILALPYEAEEVRFLKAIDAAHGGEGRAIFAAPTLPGAYALLERKSPAWEIYPLFPRPRAFEEREISRLISADLAFAVIKDVEVDGFPERSFRNTHPLTYAHIETTLEFREDLSIPPYLVFIARRAGE